MKVDSTTLLLVIFVLVYEVCGISVPTSWDDEKKSKKETYENYNKKPYFVRDKQQNAYKKLRYDVTKPVHQYQHPRPSGFVLNKPVNHNVRTINHPFPYKYEQPYPNTAYSYPAKRNNKPIYYYKTPQKQRPLIYYSAVKQKRQPILKNGNYYDSSKYAVRQPVAHKGNYDSSKFGTHEVPRKVPIYPVKPIKLHPAQSSEETYDSEKYVSPHEKPRDVPTKPIYPGEGLWSKPGIKHMPFVDRPVFTNPIKEDAEKRPQGLETFEEGEEDFESARGKFENDFREFPKNHRLTEPTHSHYEAESSEPLYPKPEVEFVPQKLYAQVRRTESEKHLPRSEISEDEGINAGRLREVIKDSKIHTVYTEEGYEDSAYDHGGHEKKAENSEGHHQHETQEAKSADNGGAEAVSGYFNEDAKRHGGDVVARTKDGDTRTKFDDFSDLETYENFKKKVQDSQSAGSEHDVKDSLLEKVGPATRKPKLRAADASDNMQINEEIKVANKKRQKFVVIVPNSSTTPTPDNSTAEAAALLKRVKRYDREKLSRRYIRKRPNYYWKKNKKVQKPDAKTVKVEYTTTAGAKLITTTEKHALPSTITTTKRPSPMKYKSGAFKRQKRYTVDHPNLDTKYDFVDVDKLFIPTQPPDLTHIKYPYYNMKNLNDLSPLRYAEDMKNIPKKTEKEMAFYESRDHIICPEVEDIDPIPDAIKNKTDENNQSEEDKTDKMGDIVPGPRIKGLGDKIDCLKAKYFGENPLDSPFFKEEVVEAPVPTFIQEYFKKPIGDPLVNNNNKISKKRDLHPIVVLDDEIVTNNPIIEETDAVLKPPYTFQEMVNKKLKERKEKAKQQQQKKRKIKIPKKLQRRRQQQHPRNIYEQIKSLENDDKDKFLVVYGSTESAEGKTNNNNENMIEEKIKTLNPTTVGYTSTSPKVSDLIHDLSNLSNEVKQNEVINLVPQNFTIDDILIPKPHLEPPEPSEVHSTSISPPSTSLLPPTTIAPQISSRSSLAYPTTSWNPYLLPQSERKHSQYVFDISQYLPQFPNHRLVNSEVHYKDEINSAEQMNVYSDVIKTINATKEIHSANADTSRIPITVKLKTANGKTKINFSPAATAISATTKPFTTADDDYEQPYVAKPNATRPQNIIVVPELPEEDEEEFQPMYVTVPPATTTPRPMVMKPAVLLSNEKHKPKLNYYEVIGLTPPMRGYKTIKVFDSLPDAQTQDGTKNVNRFYVPGMKPPLFVRAIGTLTFHQISKRSAPNDDLIAAESRQYETISRKPVVYTEIVRSRPSRPPKEEEEEDEDVDLNPRKRIYDLTPKRFTTSTATTPYEDDEYILQETEAPPEKPLRKEAPIPFKEGIPEYIYIIKQYHKTTTTTEPTTTTTSTTPSTTTIKQQNIAREDDGIPTFLKIIGQFHDQTTKREVPATTSRAFETEEEEEEEIYSSSPVKNSNPYIVYHREEPDSSATATARTDDPEARIRNLSSRLKTSIDTSKYKTIERVAVRHNLSSRFNSDTQDLPMEAEYTTKVPVILTTARMQTIDPRDFDKELETENPATTEFRAILRASFAPQTEVVPKTTVTTTTTKRIRTRTRGTTTPRPSTTETTSSSSPAFRRRRPSRPLMRTTTAAPSTSRPEIRRRVRLPIRSTTTTTTTSEVPPNHKSVYTPITERTTEKEEKSGDKKKRKIYSSYLAVRKVYDEPEESKKDEVEIIGKLTHTDTKHGGNYKHVSDAPIDYLMDSLNVNQLKDASSKPETSVTQPLEKVTTIKPYRPRISLFPNTARMVNRLAETQTEPEEELDEDAAESGTPRVIKDPSRRMYFYAKL